MFPLTLLALFCQSSFKFAFNRETTALNGKINLRRQTVLGWHLSFIPSSLTSGWDKLFSPGDNKSYPTGLLWKIAGIFLTITIDVRWIWTRLANFVYFLLILWIWFAFSLIKESLIYMTSEDLTLGVFCFQFIYFWLHWVFLVAHGFSLVAVSTGYSSLWCTGYSLPWLLLLQSTDSRVCWFW